MKWPVHHVTDNAIRHNGLIMMSIISSLFVFSELRDLFINCWFIYVIFLCWGVGCGKVEKKLVKPKGALTLLYVKLHFVLHSIKI